MNIAARQKLLAEGEIGSQDNRCFCVQKESFVTTIRKCDE